MRNTSLQVSVEEKAAELVKLREELQALGIELHEARSSFEQAQKK